MEDRFQLMLEMQRQLQLKMPPPNRVPADLRGDDMADFMRWNAWAIVVELAEAFQEVGWKPWGTNREIDHEKFMKEMVDAWHFFMNLLLCGCQGKTPAEIADEFTRRYIEKNAVNAKRQETGYDGRAEKCKQCGRELHDGGGWVELAGFKFCPSDINSCVDDFRNYAHEVSNSG